MHRAENGGDRVDYFWERKQRGVLTTGLGQRGRDLSCLILKGTTTFCDPAPPLTLGPSSYFSSTPSTGSAQPQGNFLRRDSSGLPEGAVLFRASDSGQVPSPCSFLPDLLVLV